MNHKRSQRGFTLIELMITLGLSAFMVLGVMSLFSSVSRTYNMVYNMSRAQENARFSLTFLSQDLHQAGYYGYLGNNTMVSSPDPMPSNNGPECDKDWVQSLSPLLYGFDQTQYVADDPFLDCILENDYRSDMLVIRHTDEDTTDFADLIDHTESGTGIGYDYLYSTFTTGKMFREGEDATETTPAGGDYFELSTLVWFVKDNPAGNPALYRYDTSSRVATEMVEGVELFQISLGDRSGDGTFITDYYDPANVPFWDDVLAVKVDILVRSIDIDSSYASNGICKDAVRSYQLGNYEYAPLDSYPNCYRRRFFTTIVQMRNPT
ncbi:MAG: PilW family protein [Magnetococcales bacterium]|nr:PilW family protein [Magnetococcales bacterium]